MGHLDFNRAQSLELEFRHNLDIRNGGVGDEGFSDLPETTQSKMAILAPIKGRCLQVYFPSSCFRL